jgi:hypothetical protein
VCPHQTAKASDGVGNRAEGSTSLQAAIGSVAYVGVEGTELPQNLPGKSPTASTRSPTTPPYDVIIAVPCAWNVHLEPTRNIIFYNKC